jgi:hypothetical protein
MDTGKMLDGKEGVAGSSPAEGFRNRAVARFSYLRSGSGDHFCATSGSGRWLAKPRGRPRNGAAGLRRLGTAHSDRSSSPASARAPSGHHSVANGLVRLSDRVSTATRRRAASSVEHAPVEVAGTSRTFGAEAEAVPGSGIVGELDPRIADLATAGALPPSGRLSVDGDGEPPVVAGDRPRRVGCADVLRLAADPGPCASVRARRATADAAALPAARWSASIACWVRAW